MSKITEFLIESFFLILALVFAIPVVAFMLDCLIGFGIVFNGGELLTIQLFKFVFGG